MEPHQKNIPLTEKASFLQPCHSFKSPFSAQITVSKSYRAVTCVASFALPLRFQVRSTRNMHSCLYSVGSRIGDQS